MAGRSRRALRLLDTLAYAVALTAVAFAIGAIAATVAGRNALLGAKWFLFTVGFTLLAYSAFQLRPTPLWKRDGNDGDGDDEPESVGVQSVVAETIPASYRLRPADRHSAALKLFVGSLAMLVTSFLMEAVFGVAIGA
ncbi:hypothetical protein ACFQE1_10890 [Halobium palmae]|uniref:DUF1345 domain-containing protein n=1 Tax=Halobium palmae TaxID=1776492 RepID=A0ABD5RZP4_9EURY